MSSTPPNKWAKYLAIAGFHTAVFFAVQSPLAYKFTNLIFSNLSKNYITSNGPGYGAFMVHLIVYALLAWALGTLLWKNLKTKDGLGNHIISFVGWSTVLSLLVVELMTWIGWSRLKAIDAKGFPNWQGTAIASAIFFVLDFLMFYLSERLIKSTDQ